MLLYISLCMFKNKHTFNLFFTDWLSYSHSGINDVLCTETKQNVRVIFEQLHRRNSYIPELAHVRVRSLVHWEAIPNILGVYKN